jgi:hypothetical protein
MADIFVPLVVEHVIYGATTKIPQCKICTGAMRRLHMMRTVGNQWYWTVPSNFFIEFGTARHLPKLMLRRRINAIMVMACKIGGNRRN